MEKEPLRRRAVRRVQSKPTGARGLEYGPNTTGCPAVAQAIERLYAGQTEETFWALMSALNYALEMETEVLVPLDAVQGMQVGVAPWAANPIPEEKAGSLRFWTLCSERNRKMWVPVFTSGKNALQGRSTATRPMVQKKLQDVMEQVLADKALTGVVIDPWGRSASLERSLLNGLLHAQPAMQQEMEPQAQQLENRIWDLMRQGDAFAAGQSGNAPDPGCALMAYRRAYAAACAQPDITYWPELCLRLAQYEVRYTDCEEALRLAVEARHGLRLRLAEGDETARPELEHAEALCKELAVRPAGPARHWDAHSTERSQKD